MPELRPEVQQFVGACEEIMSLLVAGETLTEDERGVIEMAAIELLGEIRPK